MLAARLSKLDWAGIEMNLSTDGFAVIPKILPARECRNLKNLYENPIVFRNRIIMEQHAFGSGEYQYFAEPLPDIVRGLRETLYPPLARIANSWRASLKLNDPYPTEFANYRALCHQAGQTRPTPLLLKYGPGDYNCLHRDLYGALAFPLQVAILLDTPEQDFTGGEFVLTEQRPRMQSRVEVVPLGRGDGVIFPVDFRPVQGVKRTYRTRMRHGVSRIRTGMRHTLGIIFHDSA